MFTLIKDAVDKDLKDFDTDNGFIRSIGGSGGGFAEPKDLTDV